MSMMTNTDLQAVLDKLARFAAEAVGDAEFNAAFDAGLDAAWSHTLTGANGIAQYLMDINPEDMDVLADLLPAARDLAITNLTPPSAYLMGIKEVSALISALNAHYKRYGYASLDAYLTSINSSTPTLRASGVFKRNLTNLARANLFVPTDTPLASFVTTGATTGNFSKLTTLSAYGGAKLVVKNVGVIGSTTAVTVTAKKLDGTTVNITASVATLTNGFETNLSDQTKSFVEVTGVAVTGATTGNTFNIVAKPDRDISAA